MGPSNGRWHAGGENLVVALAVGFFAAGLCFVPPTLLVGSDYVALWKPSFHFLTDAMREGRVPLWNPYVHLGRPYLADMSNMAFYPPTYLICLGEKFGFFLQVWLHCTLAVFGMRKLAGALLVGRWQGYLMAFTFLASGTLTARWVAGQLPACWGICYVPWLFYCAVRTEKPWQGQRVALYAGLLALQLLCLPQLFWFSAIGQAVFILCRAARLPVREAFREAARGLGQFGAACVGCAGLLGVALLPFLELVKQSNRAENSPAFANAFNLDWTHLRTLFIPLACGTNWETNLFVGTLVVASGLMGLCRVRERNVRGLLGVAVIALLLALGDRTPLFGLFYNWLPGFAGFRFHSRAALLLVVALICASGIWLSRPHPRLRTLWTYFCGVPVRYAIILLVVLQSLDLLQGTWIIKQAITYACCIDLQTPLTDSFEQAFVTELRKADLIKPLLPPPRVSLPPSLVPAGYGMIHHYSHFEAGGALSLRRPWDYLHAVLGLEPNPGKGELPPQLYTLGPIPYPDLNLSAGVDRRTLEFVLVTNPSPRAFLVYAAVLVGDYGTMLKQLASGHDIHRSALLESPLAEPLPPESALPGSAAVIRRFEPNELLVDVDARTNALLVLAEAWYPGWQAEIDGRAGVCVPANSWMRAVPVPAGRHLVRLYFRQNHLLPGLIISLSSLALLLVAVVRPGHPMPSPFHQPNAGDMPAGSGTRGKHKSKSPPPPPPARAGVLSAYRPLFRVLAAGAGLAGVWLLAKIEMQQVRVFLITKSQVEAKAHCQISGALALQNQTAQATAHSNQAVHLAERACALSGYQDPSVLKTLAYAYLVAGRPDEALVTARRARDLAWASGRGGPEAESLLKLIEGAVVQMQAPENGRK